MSSHSVSPTPESSFLPRVLHLLDPRHAGDEGTLACVAAQKIDSVSHLTWIVGDSADEQRAWSLGVRSTDRVTPFAHMPSSAVRRVRNLAADRFGVGTEGPPEIVCCYSLHALAIARRALGKRRPWRVGVLAGVPKDLYQSHRLRRLAEFAMHDATIATFSRALQNALAPAASARRGGVLLRDNIRLLDAPSDAGRSAGSSSLSATAASREVLRASLGLQLTDVVVSLLADPPEHADAGRLLFELGLCYTVGHRLVGLVRAGASQERRGARFVRDHGHRWHLLRANVPLVDIVRACDVSLIGAPGVRGPIGSAGPVAAALCAEYATPLIVAPSAFPAGADDDLAPAIVAADDSRRSVASALVRTIEHSSLRSELAQSQRAWVARSRASNRFLGTLADIFHELANTPVQRDGLPTPPELMERLRLENATNIGASA